MIRFIVALFLGWNLGANDAANVFGTAVSNRIIKFRTAAIIGSVFVIIGAVAGGTKGIETYRSIMNFGGIETAVAISVAAGSAVFIMTYLRLPVSMTHCVIAGIVTAGMLNGKMNLSPFVKIGVSWFASPIGAMAAAFVIYKAYDRFLARYIKNMIVFEKSVRIGAIAVGIYGSYSLGANNVANIVGIFADGRGIPVIYWTLFGGAAISAGIVTYSRRVMETVGDKIARIDDMGAVIAVLGSSIVVHIFSIIGVPVSSSQAIVGAVIGVGVTEGIRNIDFKVVAKIVSGWLYSIGAAGLLTFIFLTFEKMFIK